MSILYGLPIFSFSLDMSEPKELREGRGRPRWPLRGHGPGVLRTLRHGACPVGRGAVESDLRTAGYHGHGGWWVESTNQFEGLINVLPLQWMFGTKKSRSRGVWACSLVLASFWRVISMWRCITWQGSKRKYGLEAAPKCSMNTWVVASCLCFMSVSAYIP